MRAKTTNAFTVSVRVALALSLLGGNLGAQPSAP
jgi:hypothetical protein